MASTRIILCDACFQHTLSWQSAAIFALCNSALHLQLQHSTGSTAQAAQHISRTKIVFVVICTRGALNSLPLASSQLHSQSQSESESSLMSSWLSLLLPLCCCCCELPLSLLLLLLFIIFIVGFDSCGLPRFPATAYNLCTSGCVVFYYLELVAPFCAHSAHSAAASACILVVYLQSDYCY